MTAAISLTNLTSSSSPEETQAQSASIHLQILQVDDPCHLPFDSLHDDSQHPSFQGFRIIQTRMMVLTILHGLRPNQKLKSIWKDVQTSNTCGAPRFTPTTFLKTVFPASGRLHSFHPHWEYATNSILDLPCTILSTESTAAHASISSSPTNGWFRQELALRYWQDHDNLYIWAPIPIYTERNDYRSLEMALIQEWQPRLNYPFICQFFHPKKGILRKPVLNTNAQFGLATLWRRAKHKFTPKLVR